MRVIMRNIGQRIAVPADITVTVLAIREGAVLFGIEPAGAAQTQETTTATPAHEDTATRPPSGD